MRHLFRSIFLFALVSSLVAYGHYAVAQQKTIKDPAEYNAYIAALNTDDPKQKAAAMEAFINQYPNSVVRIDAMEQAMAAYQQAGNVAKVRDTVTRILQLDADNIRALAIVTFLKRADATTSGDASAAKEAGLYGERGLNGLARWLKPEGLSDADFGKLKNQVAEIFYGAVGFSALQTRDYARARQYYLKSVPLDPANLQDVYQLAVAELEITPSDLDGFWYAAKAINLARAQNNQAAAQGIGNYGKAKYRKYHGVDDGWDKIVASAGNQSEPPGDFAASITRAPTPAELAVKAVQENEPASLSFSDWEYILSFRDASPANKQAAERVWQAIQSLEKNGAAKLKIPVKVISVSKDTIRAAITDENQQANKADLEITMAGPMTKPPAPGSQIQIIGILTDYKLEPFTFLMKNGELP